MKSIAWNIAVEFLAAAMVCGIALAAPAAKTLTGVVTDMACGKSHSLMKEKDQTDAQCVRSCVKGGSPYGLVVGAKVIELKGDSAELDKYAAKRVTVSGSMNGKDFVVESVKPAR